MANSVLVIGRPGTGKSTSIRTLDPEITAIVNTIGKGLPFPGWKSKYTSFNSREKIGNMINVCETKHILAFMDIVDKDMPHIKSLIVEDSQYISAAEYIKRIDEKGLN